MITKQPSPSCAKAVLRCRASDEWMNDGRQNIFDLVQFSIARWVDDLGRSLRRAAKAIFGWDATQ